MNTNLLKNYVEKNCTEITEGLKLLKYISVKLLSNIYGSYLYSFNYWTFRKFYDSLIHLSEYFHVELHTKENYPKNRIFE